MWWAVNTFLASTPMMYYYSWKYLVNPETLRFHFYEKLMMNAPSYKGTMLDPNKPADEDEWGNKIKVQQ